MTNRPSSILEYPVVVRKVLSDMVIAIPDLGFWIQIPLPPKQIINGVPQSNLSDEYLLELVKGIKTAWAKGHKHIVEKKWVPNASSFKESVQKESKHLTVPQFAKLLKSTTPLSLNTIRREIKRGAIKAKQTKGGHFRIPRSQLEIYLTKLDENALVTK